MVIHRSYLEHLPGLSVCWHQTSAVASSERPIIVPTFRQRRSLARVVKEAVL